MTKMIVRTAAALGLGVALTACLETTDPPLRVETRIAHLAPGAGTYAVLIDGGLLLDTIAPSQYTFLAIDKDTHTYTFESNDTGEEVSTDAAHEDNITAVILMNAAAPEARSYGLMRESIDAQRVMVVNADTAAADLTVLLEGPDTATVTLAPGAGQVVDSLTTGSYGIRLHYGDIASAVTLSGFPLGTGDHGFLVIYPAASETARYARFLF